MEGNNEILIEWIKEAAGEIKNTKDTMIQNHNEIKAEIAKNREEFIIFKTKINVRTATISGIIGAFVLITSIIINVTAIKDRINNKDQIETVKTK